MSMCWPGGLSSGAGGASSSLGGSSGASPGGWRKALGQVGKLGGEPGADLVSRLSAALSIGQATRLIQLETAFDTGTLVVERCQVHEAVHADEPLSAEIDALSTNAHLELKALMGEQITLRIKLADGSWRNWHGYVAEAGQLGSDGGLGRYRLRLVAFTHWLKQRRDTRIFQDQTSAEIIGSVLSAYPQAHFKLDMAHSGPLHAITTQFRETDWAFVTRLMAREGWSWRLEHEGELGDAVAGARAARHTLVIFDHQARRPDLGSLRYSRPDMRGSGGMAAGIAGLASGPGTMDGGASQAAASAFTIAFGLVSGHAQDTITAWRTCQQVGPNAVTLAAWDERRLAGVSAQGSADIPLGQVPVLEHYTGRGERRFADGRVGAGQPASSQTAERRAQALMAALQLGQRRVNGQSAVRTLREGVRFQITEHSLYGGDDGDNGSFSVLSVRHEAANNLGAEAARILRATELEQGSYRNHFEAVPGSARIVPLPQRQPTAPGPQTAIVVAAPGEPLATDRDHRIRIQFGWQRGQAPLPGGLPAPRTLAGADTGHAPGQASSGTWVRVAQGAAGPNWGAVFTPRAGTEVLVDFLDGDIDRPIVVGQLHNGQHDLPWPAGVDAGVNHPGTVSGWHNPHLDGQGANQWLVDDATGQLRMRLASHGAATGWSELSLGRIIQQGGHGGAANGQRGQWLGEGFYGCTDGWATLRAGQGLLLSTTARRAQGSSVHGTQMDAREAVGQLKTARQLGEALSQSARHQGALPLCSHDADQAVQHHADTMCPQAHGKYNGPIGGQEARKARGRTLADAVERFNASLLHLDTPVTAAWVTPASISLFSGRDTSLTLQGDAHITSAHTVSSVSGQTTSLYTHAGGIKAITANGPLSLRAHTDAQQIWSNKDLMIQSTTDEVRVQASDSITLTAGRSQIVLEGGDITFTCPGTWTVKGAAHEWMGGGSGSASIQPLPDTRVKLFDEQIRAISKLSGKPVGQQPYSITFPDGSSVQGVTDNEGKTARIATATPEMITLRWLPEANTEDFPDVPADEGC